MVLLSCFLAPGRTAHNLLGNQVGVIRVCGTAEFKENLSWNTDF